MQAKQDEAAAAEAARARQRAMIAEMQRDNQRLLEAIALQRQQDSAEEAARQGLCVGACCVRSTCEQQQRQQRRTSGVRRPVPLPLQHSVHSVKPVPRCSERMRSGALWWRSRLGTRSWARQWPTTRLAGQPSKLHRRQRGKRRGPAWGRRGRQTSPPSTQRGVLSRTQPRHTLQCSGARRRYVQTEVPDGVQLRAG